MRDNIHSYDLINAFWHYYQNPKAGEVYNMGGARFANVSMLEAIRIIEELAGYKLNYTIVNDNRIGDHIWYVSDERKFQNHYPDWKLTYDIKTTIGEMIKATEERLR